MHMRTPNTGTIWPDTLREELSFGRVRTDITDEQIEALRNEAGEAGDLAMIEICDHALAGDDDARATCAEVIADAQAKEDTDVTDECA